MSLSRVTLCVALLLLLTAGWQAAAGYAVPIMGKDTAPAHSDTSSAPVSKTDTHASAHKEEAHHELTAEEEVSDTNKWYILHSQGLYIPLGWLPIGPYGFPTKYMILQLIAAVIIWLIYSGLAKRIVNGEPPKGAFWNMAESMLTFIRDQVVRPNIGEHDGDQFLPFLWTMFLFILVNNLLGMFPYMGSPTANVFVTGALAALMFLVLHGSAIAKMGLVHYLQAIWPHFDIPPMFGFGIILGFIIKLMIFVIELLGTVIKCGVLSIRLFANMFAGHMVLATILLFIYQTRYDSTALWGTVTFFSILGAIGLSLLELFVAFLQAFIFVFLGSLFIGMAVHPEH